MQVRVEWLIFIFSNTKLHSTRWVPDTEKINVLLNTYIQDFQYTFGWIHMKCIVESKRHYHILGSNEQQQAGKPNMPVLNSSISILSPFFTCCVFFFACSSLPLTHHPRSTSTITSQQYSFPLSCARKCLCILWCVRVCESCEDSDEPSACLVCIQNRSHCGAPAQKFYKGHWIILDIMQLLL